MRSALTHLTVVALLFSQLWLSATRGQVVCASSHRCEPASSSQHAPEHCREGAQCEAAHARKCGGAAPACAHAHSGLLAFAPEHDACSECVHVANPDDPPLAASARIKLAPAAETVCWTIVLLWLALPPDSPPMVGHWRPPADPTQRAERRALESLRLLI